MPTDGFYPAAVEDFAASSGGDFVGPVTIGVIHTTESPVGKYRSGGPRNYGNFGHTSFPHFTVDVQNGVCVVFQHISIRKAAKALKNLSGGVQTNREGAIQIEVVGSATKPFTDNPVLVAGLKALMRWIESETDIPRSSSVPFKAYPASYGTRNGVRLSYEQWQSYAGWLGHQHVPENDHGDPGAIDIKALLAVPAPTPAPVLSPAVSAQAHVAKPLPKDRVLKEGMRGQDVRNVQHALVVAGHRISEDGVFGPGTKRAVVAFQKAHKLTADGVVGPKTWAALRVVVHGS